MDPSFTHWGVAEGNLCLNSGEFTEAKVSMAITEKTKNKQQRVNSDDLNRAEILAQLAFEVGHRVKVVFMECPVGSQSANAMKSCGVSHGIAGSMRANGIQIIEVQAKAVKKALAGNPNATKAEMIEAAMKLYPDAGWKTKRDGSPTADNEHMADAIGAIHAGVLTPEFQQLMTLFKKVQ